jgi:hypothetical protein
MFNVDIVANESEVRFTNRQEMNMALLFLCLTKYRTMKTYRQEGGGGIAPRILNLGTRWR